MRLALRTDLALRTLMTCAAHAPESLRTAEVAKIANASFHHVAQVVHRLESFGLIKTVRGRNGGISLAKNPAEINIGDVVREFEGTPAPVECLQPETNTCPFVGACRARCLLEKAFDRFFDTLHGVSLADLVDDTVVASGLFTRQDIA